MIVTRWIVFLVCGLVTLLNAGAAKPTPRAVEAPGLPAVAAPSAPKEAPTENEVVAQFRNRARLCLHLLENLKDEPQIVISEEDAERLKLALRYTQILKANEKDFGAAMGNLDASVLPLATLIKDTGPGRESLLAILINEDGPVTAVKNEKNFDKDVLDLYRRVAGLSPKFIEKADLLLRRMEWVSANSLRQPEVRKKP